MRRIAEYEDTRATRVMEDLAPHGFAGPSVFKVSCIYHSRMKDWHQYTFSGTQELMELRIAGVEDDRDRST